MILNEKDYRSKVLGCWMGKNIGGTLGAPMEFMRQKNNVHFYQQELNGNPMPNDDLDIQLIWLIALEENGVDIDAQLLSEYWMLYITPHWSEYGNAKINMRAGLMPPLCGTYNNVFKDSCGAFIRSEIWACITPGFPNLAAKYAYEDAIIDHGNGEGTYAEVFCAALESAAFVESDIRKLIQIALAYIPEDCGVAKAVKEMIECYDNGKTWEEAREILMQKYRGWLYTWSHISEEDLQKGYDNGQRGWDVPSNIGILIVGLLYGEGDFAKSICTAVNCGEDTDCTAATIGSIFGIIHGIEAIPQEWITPIGEKIVTCSLNLGELGTGKQLPQDITEMTNRVTEITKQVLLRYRLPLGFSAELPNDFSALTTDALYPDAQSKTLFHYMNGPVYKFLPIQVAVDYGDEPTIKNNVPKKIKLTLINKFKTQELVNLRWLTPEDCTVLPAKNVSQFITVKWFEDIFELEFELLMESVQNHTNRFTIEMTVNGKANIMYIPIVLLNGN